MLCEHGIYTLWGSKPMTLVTIEHYSQEKLEASPLKSNRLSRLDSKKRLFPFLYEM